MPGIPNDERHRRETAVKRALAPTGIHLSAPGSDEDSWGPVSGTLESGHQWFTLLHQGTGHWTMSVFHPGDSSGTHAESHLGTEDSRVPGRVMEQFRKPQLMKAMGEQWQRASAAGDPHGEHRLYFNAPTVDHHASHLFNDYEPYPEWEDRG